MRHGGLLLYTYHVRGALQEEVDGSANILVAVMKRYHTLILVLASHFHQLEKAIRITLQTCASQQRGSNLL